MTASIGIATYPQDGDSVEALLKSADMAMYDAKQNGRNTYRFFDSAMSEASARTMQIYRGLGEALEKNQLSLAFQPKFGGLQQELVGAEALIRWRHPEMGDIPPMEFIPVAERTGQVVQIGDWVIAEVCRPIRRWEAAGLPRVKVAINLSPEQSCGSQIVWNACGPWSRQVESSRRGSCLRSPRRLPCETRNWRWR